jgi:hypothetical protein
VCAVAIDERLVGAGANGKLPAHGGGTAGFTSQVLGLTALDCGVVILTNSVGGGPFISAVNQRLRISRQVARAGDELLIETVYGALQFRSVPGVDGLFVCTTDFFVGALAQLLTDKRGRATWVIYAAGAPSASFSLLAWAPIS